MSFICANCGYIGRPKKYTRGSFVIEVFLWLLFLLPGIIYSIWRLTTKVKVCPKCKAPNMIPENTPKGRELMARFKGV